MFPKMMPFSVEATLTFALMLQKSLGASTMGCGFSTNFKSPREAISRVLLEGVVRVDDNQTVLHNVVVVHVQQGFSTHRIVLLRHEPKHQLQDQIYLKLKVIT
jgi:hypothetical protein